MLDINFIRENPQTLKIALALRGSAIDIDALLALDERRRRELVQEEDLRAVRNRVSKEIGLMKDKAAREAKIAEMRVLGEQLDGLTEQVRQTSAELQARLLEIPNIPDPSTPKGADDSENVTVKQVGELRVFDFEPKAHWDFAPALGILNFERGVKLSGSRFYVLSGDGSRLQRALIAFMLDLRRRQGYTEQYLPYMVRMVNFEGAGQLPKFADNIYRDHEEDYGWVTTAEVPLTNLHRDEILTEEQLPLLYTAHTPCFRREKVAAGKDVRGIKRGHQFDKVEMYIYCKPEESADFLKKMTADAEETCTLLGIPYRVRQLCSGDLGFGSQITYDIELWAPGQQEWLEVSSCSNVGDFQARRANLRYRKAENGKVQYVHTLNGSGLGLPRTLIAVMENYQQADGSIVIPEVLRPYMGGQSLIC
ncbi:MAG TPA: serine--tRNA ligase [Anaerolineales bacterium]|nr:serine--tRNA ligase [Anaerolineales bacterium]